MTSIGVDSGTGYAVSEYSQRMNTDAPRARSAALPVGKHEDVPDLMQRRIDAHPSHRPKKADVEHPFGTLKARMGSTHFLMKTLPKVSTEMRFARAGLQPEKGDEAPRSTAADGAIAGVGLVFTAVQYG